MSWQSFVDDLIDTGRVDHACIVGIDQKILYSTTKDFSLGKREVEITNQDLTTSKKEINEIEMLIEFMNAPDKTKMNQGIWMNGKRYSLIKEDEDANAVYFVTHKGGAAVARTKTTLVVGVWEKGNDKYKLGGNCNLEVTQLAEALADSGS